MSLPGVVNGRLLCRVVPRSGRSVSARRTAAIVERDVLLICVHRGHIASLRPPFFRIGTAGESYCGDQL
jgi:hypothetical protein